MSNNLPTYLTISTDIDRDLSDAIESIAPDKIAVLVDENTRKHCLPLISIKSNLIIEIKSGEKEKTLSTCQHIWSQLTSNGFTRNSLLVNLGGGVIGDMGGFAAVTFKRGMAFINVPTTLLSQVDASIGGKLGVDFDGLKNHIGVFQEPNKVIVYPKFLDTLPERELKSGFAEVIKHSLIRSESQWGYLKTKVFQELNWEEIIPRSIAIKNEVVNEDPREKGVRKILNYGHTIGHAIESHFLDSTYPLLHGEAIAWGMMLENKLAVEEGMLDKDVSKEIENYISSIYELPSIVPDYETLKNHLLQDKKKDAQGIRFSLLTQINSCTYDVLIEERVLKQVLK
ncbi:3-dehydroquinate synthase [Ekhidna lutea]|uniref:3-dehydroquinate synthase n=1 Tax=Ekhidna lutea TaxID=447679 RepID=A0A239JI03_EKHLU|nr:3-dehydroquinate synthase [Ekhidna lutea]SNT05439.1 3-dehydroquinate synthase [Ekhidna lutea]